MEMPPVIVRSFFPKTARLLVSTLLAGTLLLSALPPARAFSQNPATVFINEIHYDNTGTDAGEAIEIAGPAGTDLTGWSIVLYNGSGGAAYTTTPLSGTIPDQQNGFGTVSVSYPSNGIQNGAPDGIALVNAGGQVIQFLSYEGTFTAVGGPADGLISTDIGVSETGNEPLGLSLQLTGSGSVYQDFSWNAPAAASFGQPNSGQNFGALSTPALGVSVTPSSFSEAAGAGAATGTVSRTGSTAADLSVTLTSADTSEATVPASVTIPAGVSSATFSVAAVDDTEADGNQTFTISAAASGYTSGSATITVIDDETVTRIHDIQGASQTSPKVGQTVTNVPGIVTAVRSNGFYLQDPNPDSDDATSEGIFVFTSSAPNASIAVGAAVNVNGTVSEFIPGGASTGNLSTTEITSPTVTVVSTGNPLPAPTVIGIGGRVPPTQVIEDDSFAVFDPASDGIDFYESLEGMLVQVNNAVAVGPTAVFSEGTTGENREIPLLPDGNGSPRTARGGIYITPTDFNPERLIVGDVLNSSVPDLPAANVGDSFPGAIVGVIDYSFGNFKLYTTGAVPPLSPANLAREVAAVAQPEDLSTATFNVENLDIGDGQAKFDSLAAAIVGNLRSPDILSLEEVQDNDGPTDDGVVDASLTLDTLVSAITAAGGPAYQYRVINPVNDQDGGEGGGNIRVVFLFNPNRVSFIDRSAPSGTDLSTTAVSAVNGPTGAELSFSPGRIDPTNPAFNSSRKPLAGEFLFNGHKLFVIGNHFNSKGGDTPLFGSSQPPVLNSEPQRIQQATVVNSFVQSLLAIDPTANVVVLGDLNDFQFSTPLATLQQGGILNDLITGLPENEQYSYVFDGNSQDLDHILVGNTLLPVASLDVVHINSEFADQMSDHEPLLSRLNLPVTPLSVSAISPNRGPAGTQVTITGTGFVPGETTVSFRGGVVVSPVAVNGAGTEITLTVPAGARTGKVLIQTSAGKVTSPGRFFVTRK